MNCFMFKQQLKAAFEAARQAGVFARQSFWCCQTCGCASVPDDAAEYVFYHDQDNERMAKAMRRQGTKLFKPEDVGTYLCWGTNKANHHNVKEVGAKLVNIFQDAGLHVEWDGSEDTRIWVGMVPQPAIITLARDEYFPTEHGSEIASSLN